MSEKPVQHVFIPGLWDSLEIWQRDFEFQPAAPQLVKLLSSLHQFKKCKQDRKKTAGLLPSVYSLLEGTTSSDRKHSHARACYEYDFGKESSSALIKEVLCADPIELEAGMNDISIGHMIIEDLTEDEHQQLAEELNQHFAQDGWQFVVSALDNWYLLLPEDQKPDKTLPVYQALGRSLRSLIDDIKGIEGLQWSRQLNELQMLLFGSMTNELREKRGKQAIKSFWMWDIHATSDGADFKPEFIQGGGYEGQVIANYYGLDWSDNDSLGGSQQQGSGIYLYTGLLALERINHLEAWQSEVTELERFLLGLFENNTVDITLHGCNGYSWNGRKKPFWKLLSKHPKGLQDFL